MKRTILPYPAILVIALGVMVPLVAAHARLLGSPAPEIENQTWINSAPVKLADLRGKVVFLQFWTYG